MSAVHRGSDREIAARALAAEEQVGRLEADLAALKEHRHLLTRQLAAARKRLPWSPEARGFLLGLALAVVVGPAVLVGLVVVLRAILWRSSAP